MGDDDASAASATVIPVHWDWDYASRSGAVRRFQLLGTGEGGEASKQIGDSALDMVQILAGEGWQHDGSAIEGRFVYHSQNGAIVPAALPSLVATRDRQRLKDLMDTCAAIETLRQRLTLVERQLAVEILGMLEGNARDNAPTPERAATVTTLEHGLALLRGDGSEVKP